MATELSFVSVNFEETGKTGYASQPMLVFGSSIGEGNYSSPPGEWINLESNPDVAPTSTPLAADDKILNLEALSNGKIPKGCKSIDVLTWASNSAVATGHGIRFMTTASADNGVRCIPIVVNVQQNANGVIPCDANGDIYQSVTEAGDTLNAHVLYISRVQVN
jgi:hypothetical protein